MSPLGCYAKLPYIWDLVSYRFLAACIVTWKSEVARPLFLAADSTLFKKAKNLLLGEEEGVSTDVSEIVISVFSTHIF